MCGRQCSVIAVRRLQLRVNIGGNDGALPSIDHALTATTTEKASTERKSVRIAPDAFPKYKSVFSPIPLKNNETERLAAATHHDVAQSEDATEQGVGARLGDDIQINIARTDRILNQRVIKPCIV